jgi:CBS domain-containing protein
MTAKVSDVLKQKGSRVMTVAPNQTVASFAEILAQNRIGAAPVTDTRGRLIGIISERDVVRGIAELGASILTHSVEELMTREVETCAPDDAIVELMAIMTNQRIRHLPVVADGELCGLVSIGDVVKQRLAEAQQELDELHRYISSSL